MSKDDIVNIEGNPSSDVPPSFTSSTGVEVRSMKLKYVTFISQLQAECVIPRDDMALISITEPPSGNNFMMMPEFKHKWKHFVRVEFHDIDVDKKRDRVLDSAEIDEYTLFNIHHACKIIEFVQNIKDDIVSLVVHCHAGISRSAAVALFFSEIYGLNIAPGDSDLYNRTVYRVLSNTYDQTYRWLGTAQEDKKGYKKPTINKDDPLTDINF